VLNDSARNVLGVFSWILWPTWVLMIDAEHLGTIMVVVLLSAPLNGLWYFFLAGAFWYSFEGVRWVRKANSRRSRSAPKTVEASRLLR